MRRVVLFTLTFTATALHAQSILPADLLASVASDGPSSVAVVPAAGSGFKEALRITTAAPGLDITAASLTWTNTIAVQSSDRLQLTFWVRKVAPDDIYNVRATVSLESDTVEMPLLRTVFPCNLGIWAKYSFPVSVPNAIDPGGLRLVFRHGLGPQTYEIGGLSLTNKGAPAAAPSTFSTVISSTPLSSYSAYFDSAAGGGSARVVAAVSPAFSEAIQIQVNGASPFIYNAGLGWNNAAAVVKNDALLLSFYARLLESKNGALQAQIVFERNSDPYDKSLLFNFPVPTSEWQLLQVPFRANDNFKIGAAHLVFQFGAGQQRFEIAGIELRNYGALADLSVLPSKVVTSVNAENVQILSEARKRIEQIRQAPITIAVTNAAGAPVTGVEVRVQQLRHAFRFGSAVTAARLKQAGVDNDTYRSRVASHFTTSVLENDLKWPLWECATCKPTFEQLQTREMIQWLRDHNIPVRGHNLIWPSLRNMPGDVRGLTGDALRKRISTHFDNVLTDPGVAGKLYQWDVQNEPFDNYDVQGRVGGVAGVGQSNGLLGNEEMLRWFGQARELAPNAQLFLNDYNNLESATVGQHEDYFYRVVEWLQKNNAALDALGFQAHFGGARPLARMQEVMDRFAKFALPMAITEFDFNSADEAAQATFTRDFMTLIYSRPEFSDFLMWGFWSGSHWLPQGAMYATDWSSKKNALTYNSLLFQEWWTNDAGLTGDDGSFTSRAFQGDYQITVVGPSGPITKTVTLVEPTVITIALPTQE